MPDVQATRKDACWWCTKSRGNPPRLTSANSPTLLARWGPYLSEPLAGLVFPPETPCPVSPNPHMGKQEWRLFSLSAEAGTNQNLVPTPGDLHF